MKFSKRYTTTWHDTDLFRQVRPSQILVYMQQTSNDHMASCGQDLDRLRDSRGLAFILSRISVAYYKPLYAFEDIEVQTWTCPSRGHSIYRAYRVLRGEEVIAESYTTWALLDIKTGMLCRYDPSLYPEFEDEEPPMIDLPARFRLPQTAELTEVGTRSIVYSDLDYNRHMNNTHYPDMLCDFLPIDRIQDVRGMTLSYLREAALGDLLSVRACEKDGVYYFRTVNGSGDVCLEATVHLS